MEVAMQTRIEKDALGPVTVPANAYWGAQTQRAIALFPISGMRNHPELIAAMVRIKKAAAVANGELGGIPRAAAAAIVQAADEVLDGRFPDQFPIDVFQMGAGTALHMNVNEVLANRANEILGGGRGTYEHVHPNDHVNRGQSTNDVFPTAMRIAAATLAGPLVDELDRLSSALADKAAEFDDVVKSGRTHLMDAAPVTLGQEVRAWSRTVAALRDEVARGRDAVCEIGLGGSAVGTGLNTVKGYRARTVALLAELTGLPLRSAADLREAMQSQRPVGLLSAATRTVALELVRIFNDLRLMGSGPMTGLAELELPEVAPGSSIMPGKVNPTMPEMGTMAMFFVAGLDTATALALQAGQLELNVMMPLMALDLNLGLTVMTNAIRQVRTRTIEGLKANRDHCRRYYETSGAAATALTPVIGYAKAAEATHRATHTGVPIRELLVAEGLVAPEALDAALDPARLVDPHGEDAAAGTGRGGTGA
jgi:aspartate ammonia-lyase